MRRWLEVRDDLLSLEELLGHNNFHTTTHYPYPCKFCEARGLLSEGAYTVIYNTEA